MPQTSLTTMLTFLLAPIILAVVIAVAIGATSGICRRIIRYKKDLPYKGVVISRGAAMGAWNVIYTQASNADLEMAKYYITINGAVLIAATASITIWPGAYPPVLAVMSSLFGVLISATPLTGLRDEHQRRLGMAARILKEQPTGEIMPFLLPSTEPHRFVIWASRLSLAFTMLSIVILVVHAIISSLPNCKAHPERINFDHFIICAPHPSKISK
jgi:hypothetical protein